MTKITNAQAREMHRQHAELCKQVERLTRACAYGNGDSQERYATSRARDALFTQMLTLRGVTFKEWVRLDHAQRKAVWGFEL